MKRIPLLVLAVLVAVGVTIAPHTAHAQGVKRAPRYTTLGQWANYCVLARRDNFGNYTYQRTDGLTNETIAYSSDNNPSGGEDAAHQACSYTLDTTHDSLSGGGTAQTFLYYPTMAPRADYISCDAILGYDGNWREVWVNNTKEIHGTYVGKDGQTYTIDQGYLQIAIRDDLSSQVGSMDCSSFIGLTPQIYSNGTNQCNCGAGGSGSGSGTPTGSTLTLPPTPKRVPAPHKGKTTPSKTSSPATSTTSYATINDAAGLFTSVGKERIAQAAARVHLRVLLLTSAQPFATRSAWQTWVRTHAGDAHTITIGLLIGRHKSIDVYPGARSGVSQAQANQGVQAALPTFNSHSTSATSNGVIALIARYATVAARA